MGHQDSWFSPPFNAAITDESGKLTDIWRQWFEQLYEWDAPDALQQTAVYLPLLPTILHKYYEYEDIDEDTSLPWMTSIHGLLQRLNDLEAVAHMQENTKAFGGPRRIACKPVDVTSDRSLGTVYTNNTSTTIEVHVTVEIT